MHIPGLCLVILPHGKGGCISSDFHFIRPFSGSQQLDCEHCHSQELHSYHWRNVLFHSGKLSFTVTLWCFLKDAMDWPPARKYPEHCTLGMVPLLDTLICMGHTCAQKQSKGWLIELYDHSSCALCTTSLSKRPFFGVIRGWGSANLLLCSSLWTFQFTVLMNC